MEVLILPTIATPLLQNQMNYEASQLPYLQGIRLEHPVWEEDKFEISLLIGAHYYRDIVENNIIRENGPTAVKSKIRYLLSGQMINTTVSTVAPSMMNILVQHKKEEIDLERFLETGIHGSYY